MPRETGSTSKSRPAEGRKAPANNRTGSRHARKAPQPFTFCFAISYRDLTVPEYPNEGYPTGNVSRQVRTGLINLFTRLLATHSNRLEGQIQIAIAWQPRDSTHEFDLAEIRPVCEKTVALFRNSGEHQAVAISDGKRGVSIRMIPSLELSTSRLRKMLADITGDDKPLVFVPDNENTKNLIEDIIGEILFFVSRLSPDQQCRLGEALAYEYDNATGQPAAFVTFSNLSSEFLGVRDACEFLGRSRSAVTTYVQEGLLPAIRIGERQYLFFRKQLERFCPPKKGPKTKLAE